MADVEIPLGERGTLPLFTDALPVVRSQRGGGDVVASSVGPRATVRRGKVTRRILERVSSASCRTCGTTWAGPWALAEATRHAEQPGHDVAAEYRVSFLYSRAQPPQ